MKLIRKSEVDKMQLSSLVKRVDTLEGYLSGHQVELKGTAKEADQLKQVNQKLVKVERYVKDLQMQEDTLQAKGLVKDLAQYLGTKPTLAAVRAVLAKSDNRHALAAMKEQDSDEEHSSELINHDGQSQALN